MHYDSPKCKHCGNNDIRVLEIYNIDNSHKTEILCCNCHRIKSLLLLNCIIVVCLLKGELRI